MMRRIGNRITGYGRQRRRRSREHTINVWPGWVDALSSLVMVVIFVLMVFIIAQFYMSNTLSNRDQALTRLNRQLTELSDLLAMEREANADLRVNIAQLSAELQSSTANREVADRQPRRSADQTGSAQRPGLGPVTSRRSGHRRGHPGQPGA